MLGITTTSSGDAQKPRTAHISGVVQSVSLKSHRLVVLSSGRTYHFHLVSDSIVQVNTTHATIKKLKRGERVGVMYEWGSCMRSSAPRTWTWFR